jgi:Phage tail protein
LLKLTFTNSKGLSLAFTQDRRAEYFLRSVSGIDGIDTDLQLQQAPYQDGKTFIASTLNVRDITLEIDIYSSINKDVYDYRRELLSLFNPKLEEGILRIEYGNSIKEIRVVPDTGPKFPSGGDNRIGSFQKTIINLVASDPSFYDPKTEKRTLASFVGGFSFPFSFPLSFGEVGDFLEVENKGDVDTPVFVVFKGPLKNPVLENKTTGQKITVTQEIPAGESLEINTAFGKKSVFRVLADGSKVSAFNWVDPKSKLWQLIPGVNEISYSATDEAGNAAASISFNHRYVGV